MKNIQFILGGIAFIFVEFLAIPQSIDTKPKEEYALIIHGGTGPITRIHVMEASPLFNAGKGAIFTNAGTNELNASIMDGSNLKVGAVLAMYLS